VIGLTSSKRTEEAAILFHGFPAHRGEKNIDLARAIHSKTGLDTFVIHYRGLGNSPGIFSFAESVKESLALAKGLIDQNHYQQLHVIGHSWGGLVAVNVIRAVGPAAGKLILLSPFSQFPDSQATRAIINTIREEVPDLFGTLTAEQILQDIAAAKEQFDPNAVVLKLNNEEVTIIQALRDEEVPAIVTRTFLKHFPLPVRYIELDQDHSFQTNRNEMIEIVVSLFSRGL
jgi:pimeloyl-ACP methyl ester carboxylesterase